MKRSITLYVYYVKDPRSTTDRSDPNFTEGALFGSQTNGAGFGLPGVFTVDGDAPAQWPAKVTYKVIAAKALHWKNQRLKIVLKKKHPLRRVMVVDTENGRMWSCCFIPDEWDGHWVTRTEERL